MSARYAPLPNPRDLPTDREQELEAAFESDGEDDLPYPHTQPHHHQPSPSIPGTYDFERDRDYDYVRPPPGSPPGPSARALPNGVAIGNSNGLVPDEDAVARPAPPRWGFLRRAAGAVLPTHYARLPTGEPAQIAGGGGGMMNDGVFGNVVAKPVPMAERAVRDENGDVHMVPEDSQKDMPPSYEAARADAVPAYWETTVHAPGMEFGAEMIVEDLPTGSVFIFIANCFVSFFFQFVGFVMTYLLHTSHAAKFGSRAGLGMTMIQFGFYSRSSPMPQDVQDNFPTTDSNVTYIFEGANGQTMNMTMDAVYQEMAVARWLTMREWLSFLLMTVGWFLLLTSLVGFWRVKRWEQSIRSSSIPEPQLSQADLDEEIATRRQLEDVFGIPLNELEERQPDDDLELTEQARLARNLRDAGLL